MKQVERAFIVLFVKKADRGLDLKKIHFTDLVGEVLLNTDLLDEYHAGETANDC